MITPALLLGIGVPLVLLAIVGATLLKRRWSVEPGMNDDRSLSLRWPGVATAGRPSFQRHSEPPPAIEVSGLSKTEAEEWLDWLENHGYRQCELTFVDPVGFTVRHQSTAA